MKLAYGAGTGAGCGQRAMHCGAVAGQGKAGRDLSGTVPTHSSCCPTG